MLIKVLDALRPSPTSGVLKELNYASPQLRILVPLALFISAPIHGLDKNKQDYNYNRRENNIPIQQLIRPQ